MNEYERLKKQKDEILKKDLLFKRVEELQKALQFYAEPDTYCIEHLNQFGYIIIDKDNGEIARQALKGEMTNGE
jgi:hypothetical protein